MRKGTVNDELDTPFPARQYTIHQPGRLDEVGASLLIKMGLGGLLLMGFSVLGLAATLITENWQPVTIGGLTIPAWSLLKAGPGLGLVLAALTVIALAWHDTLQAMERWTGRDPNGDGDIGGSHVVLLNTRPNQAVQATPEERLRDQLGTFIRGCATDTSLRRWQPVIGRERYQEWRDDMIQAGFAEWNIPGEPRQGWQLTCPVEEVIAALA